MSPMVTKTLWAGHWIIRLGLFCVLAVDTLIAANLLVILVTSGPSGLKGYFQHMALTGVDITRTRPSELEQILRASMRQFAVESALLGLITVALFLLHRWLGRRRESVRKATRLIK